VLVLYCFALLSSWFVVVCVDVHFGLLSCVLLFLVVTTMLVICLPPPPLAVIINSFPPAPSLTYLSLLISWLRSSCTGASFLPLHQTNHSLNYAYAAQYCTDSYASCWPVFLHTTREGTVTDVPSEEPNTVFFSVSIIRRFSMRLQMAPVKNRTHSL
jgi:hypothetical protein